MKNHRLPKVNKHLQRTFGAILQQEADLPPDVLVTITRVDTTPNLKSAHVYLSVLPVTEADNVLKQLTPQLYELQGSLNRALDFRPLPRISLRIDYGAERAEHVDRALKDLANERSDTPAHDAPSDG